MLDCPRYLEPECQKLQERIYDEFRGDPDFTGIHRLTLKGLALGELADKTVDLITRLLPRLRDRVIDPSQKSALPLTVMVLLPILVSSYETDRKAMKAKAIGIADAVQAAAEACTERSQASYMSFLAKLFRLYCMDTYTKPKGTWLSDVCKYFAQSFFVEHDLAVFSVLLQVLDQIDSPYRSAVVDTLSGMLRAVAVTGLGNVHKFWSDLTVVINKLFRSQLWEEGYQILNAAAAAAATAGAGSGSNPSLSVPSSADKSPQPSRKSMTPSAPTPTSPAPSSSAYTMPPASPSNRQSLSVDMVTISQHTLRDHIGRVLRTCGRELSHTSSVQFSSHGENLSDIGRAHPTGSLTSVNINVAQVCCACVSCVCVCMCGVLRVYVCVCVLCVCCVCVLCVFVCMCILCLFVCLFVCACVCCVCCVLCVCLSTRIFS